MAAQNYREPVSDEPIGCAGDRYRFSKGDSPDSSRSWKRNEKKPQPTPKTHLRSVKTELESDGVRINGKLMLAIADLTVYRYPIERPFVKPHRELPDLLAGGRSDPPQMWQQRRPKSSKAFRPKNNKPFLGKELGDKPGSRLDTGIRVAHSVTCRFSGNRDEPQDRKATPTSTA